MITLALLPLILALGSSQPGPAPGDALAAIAQQIVSLLKLRPGDSAAYLGSGGRLFALPLASAAGAGTVYVIDVDDGALDDVRQMATRVGRSNIETRNVSAGGPPLGKAVSTLTMVDTWQHLQSAPQYFRALGAMLSPDGRLAIIDLTAPYRSLSDTDIASAATAAGYARTERHRVGEADVLVFFK